MTDVFFNHIIMDKQADCGKKEKIIRNDEKYEIKIRLVEIRMKFVVLRY